MDNPTTIVGGSVRFPFAVHLAVALLVLVLNSTASTQESPFAALDKEYQSQTLPLVKQYCSDCHSTKDKEGELDLERFASMADVRQDPRPWQKVVEMLSSGDMPPKDSDQPTAQERQQLQQWVTRYLHAEALANAGDPGPVVLRRLSNAEYTYTLRDLTGVDSLEPAREFPVDGAAGEGFTNTGNALVMSPSLITKYLDAAKEVAGHAVLLPESVRFSLYTTPRDWTNETLAQIRAFYGEFTDTSGGTRVNLQGVVSETNQGGRLPLQEYLAATLIERNALRSGNKSIDVVAHDHHLNAKYLGLLWNTLNGTETSLLLDRLRARWHTAKPTDVAALTTDIVAWQQALWTFGTVGHIGKIGGPKRWMQASSPLISRQELKFKIPAANGAPVTISLVASDAGDGSIGDFVIWQQPRLVAAGRPDVLLRDVRDLSRDLTERRERMFASASKCLQAVDSMVAAQGKETVNELALKYQVEVGVLSAWFDYLGVAAGGDVKIENHFTNKLIKSAGHDFINGWGSNETPMIFANSSDQAVRIPGDAKPHGVVVHPSQTLRVAVGWHSPIAANMKVDGRVKHAHAGCGNGVAWWLELRRGATRQQLANGVLNISAEAIVGPIDNLAVLPGDFISLLVGPRDGNHFCDLTAIEMTLTEVGDNGRVWDLAEDISSDILAGNPHADRLGHKDIWHFYTEPDKRDSDTGPIIPPGSLLSKWQITKDPTEKQKCADELQTFLLSGPPAQPESPDAKLYQQLTAVGGPLFSAAFHGRDAKDISASEKNAGVAKTNASTDKNEGGIDPALFGKHPNGSAIAATDLCVQAPHVIEFQLPDHLADGCEFVVNAALDAQTGAEGSVQLRVVQGKSTNDAALIPSGATLTVANGPWTADNRQISYAAPILVNDESVTRKRFESAFDDFRQLFPAALCYTKIVPVDEVVTLMLFYREDDHLCRLMLDEAQQARLDRMWEELHYISQDSLTLVDALEQLIQYATQDADPKVFEPLRQPFGERAVAFRQRLVESEPKHLEALSRIASGAYRRPLSENELGELKTLYSNLRGEEIPHDEAVRLTLSKILVSPAFLYRIEQPAAGSAPVRVSDWELASRLSYFLWSSQPDEELRQVANAGGLSDTETSVAQTRRMLHDAKTRRLATEFGCQWLHIYDFDHLDEKSERHFPTFVGLRGAMYEESIRFFTDLFQNNGSVLEILNADYTFVNEELAKHYDIVGVIGPEWRRVDGMKERGRGGIFGLAATLTKQSGASRTSPVLRGNWISETLLGEKLPKPPKNVPQLPEDDAGDGLSVRQMVEKHRSLAECAKCHDRIDPLGFALEGFDAIGRFRAKDSAGRPIETNAVLKDGSKFDGLPGLRNYLLTQRKDQFVRHFCRKLLGYALGRGVQLSDEPLLDEMVEQLGEHDYRLSVAVETIVRSKQFRFHRGSTETEVSQASAQ